MGYFGQRIRRLEDPRLITGHGSFVDDVRLRDTLHARVLRSPHAHALIKSIDASGAGNVHGVVAVLTWEDLPEPARYVPNSATVRDKRGHEVQAPRHPTLAIDSVCYVGQAVALVIATERYVAQDALELVDVDYEPLDPVVDPYDAAADGSPAIHESLGTNAPMRLLYEGGDVDAAFSRPDHVVTQRYDVQRLAPSPLEPRGMLAQYDAQADLLTVWSSTQAPHNLRSILASLLNRSEDAVRVIAPDVGGGFGEKEGTFSEDIFIAFAALSLGRPVKWVADRQENMLTFHGRGHSVDLEAAVNRDGTVRGVRARIVADLGAYFLPPTAEIPDLAAHRVIGPYSIPAVRVEVVGVVTNKTPTGAYRGAGGPEAAFCTERTIDIIARDLDLDPAEVRRRNFISPEAFPYDTPTGLTYDSGNYRQAFDKALELAEYSKWREKAGSQEGSEGPLIGVGLASVIKAAGGGGPMMSEDVRVVIDAVGHITVYTGVSPHGQGSDTAFAQLVGHELGVELSAVHVVHGDTAQVPSGGGTAGSRNLAVGGSALYLALKEAADKLSVIAAHQLGCSPEDIVLAGGRAASRGEPARSVSFAELAASAYDEEKLPPEVEAGLDFSGSFTLPGNPFAFAAHVVVVEVSRETGDVAVVRYAAVHDCGRIINPAIVDGQMHGGIVQGIGQALTEDFVYSADGQPLTGSLADYALPVAEQVPEIVLDTFETPTPTNPLGVRGIGELPTVASPVAVANAVMDALSGLGIRHVDTPLTPDRVWRALRERGAAR